MSSRKPALPDFVERYVNLASPRLGSSVVEASDDFFAPKERLIKDEDPVFIPDKFDDHGKWMDGWESRRKRTPGHDHCVVKLGVGGVIHGVDIDTRHFTGNYPPAASLEAAYCAGAPSADTHWEEILPQTPLGPDAQHLFAVASNEHYNHLRLHIYPDGGIARLKVYGEPAPQWQDGDREASYELSALGNGGRILGYNDAHYGSVWTLLTAGRGVNMGDGWETRRRREPGHDWIVIALGAPGTLEGLEVDTCHFKGNYPDRCSVQAALIEGDDVGSILEAAEHWPELLPAQKLEADAIHNFRADALTLDGQISHLRLNIYPDGGVSRFRAFGRLA